MNAPLTPKVRPITLAILAMGGEGGGVLANWIVDLAEHGGHLAQATSVPGVAQRTGATIYYIELFPQAAAAGREPVLALMPVPGDVDIVIASELMEAGRAVQRGLVTPDRTTLLASTHRVYAMTEKIALGDGRADDAALIEGAQTAARRLVAFDMAAIAEACGSVISAVLFGALAGSGALPFPRAAFEAAIRRGGVGVEASLAAFAAGFEAARADAPPPAAPARAPAAPEPAALGPLLAEARRMIPEPALAVVRLGLARLADYQDLDYARVYLARLEPFAQIERRHGEEGGRLLSEVARQLALGMAYEDTIRVAELKIRPSRFARVRQEMKIRDGQVLEIAEFMHPRVQEIADTLPAGLGRRLLGSRRARRLVERFTASGKVVRTTSIRGFLLLAALAALKPMRRRSLRFQTEQAGLNAWLDAVRRAAGTDYALAVEAAACRGLVRGYGETHERGRANFERLMALLPKLDAATLARLRRAACADETGEALERAVKDV